MKIRPLELIDKQAIESRYGTWVEVEGGLSRYHPPLRGQFGLYRLSLKGRVVAIGTGTDKKGGMAKRLSDFHRTSPSGRNHYAGNLIYANRMEIKIEVLLLGRDYPARLLARQLRDPMVALHKPAWTVPGRRVRQRG